MAAVACPLDDRFADASESGDEAQHESAPASQSVAEPPTAGGGPAAEESDDGGISPDDADDEDYEAALAWDFREGASR